MQNHLGQRLKTKKMIGLRLLLRRKILNRGFYKKCPQCEDGLNGVNLVLFKRSSIRFL